MLFEPLQTAGPPLPRALPRFIDTMDPSNSPPISSSPRFPGLFPVIILFFLLRRFRRRGRGVGGLFSICLSVSFHRCGRFLPLLLLPSTTILTLALLKTSARYSLSGLTHAAFDIRQPFKVDNASSARPPWASSSHCRGPILLRFALSLRYYNVGRPRTCPSHPEDGFVDRLGNFSMSSSLPPLIQATRLLTFTSLGLSPTVQTPCISFLVATTGRWRNLPHPALSRRLTQLPMLICM